MTRLSAFIFLFFILNLTALAQKPVLWTWELDKVSGVLRFKVQLDEGWHMYSQYISAEIGPVPLTFSFEELSGIELVGGVTEPKAVRKYDENFEAYLDFFEKEAEFQQRFTGPFDGPVKGTITYMICNETTCLPPVDIAFVIEPDKN